RHYLMSLVEPDVFEPPAIVLADCDHRQPLDFVQQRQRDLVGKFMSNLPANKSRAPGHGSVAVSATPACPMPQMLEITNSSADPLPPADRAYRTRRGSRAIPRGSCNKNGRDIKPAPRRWRGAGNDRA